MVAGQVLGGPTAAEVADGVGGDRRQTLLAVAFGVLGENLAEAVPLFVVQDPGDLGELVDDLLLGSFMRGSVGGGVLWLSVSARHINIVDPPFAADRWRGVNQAVRSVRRRPVRETVYRNGPGCRQAAARSSRTEMNWCAIANARRFPLLRQNAWTP